MSGSYLLAIDAGTGSCRALLFTQKGEEVTSSLREWTHREPPDVPGGQDFDVHGNWQTIAACIWRALPQRAPAATMSAPSRRPACARASCLEAAAFVACGHRDISTELTGRIFTEVVFTGGAAKSTFWPQITADVLGLPVHVPAVTESSALGAAICAGTGAGICSSLSELESDPRPFPLLRAGRCRGRPVYDERYAIWRQVYQRMLAISDDGLLSPLWRAAGA